MKKIISILIGSFLMFNANAQIWQKTAGKLVLVQGADTLTIDSTAKYTTALLQNIKGNVGVSTNTTDTVLVWDILTRTIKKKIIGGVTSLSAIGSTPNANGGTITGSVLNLQPADATFGGVLTAISQSIKGQKNFLDALYIKAATSSSKMTLGATTGIAFGVHAASTNTYGLFAGVDNSFGDAWLQSGNSASAVAYNLGLQNSGGYLNIGAATNFVNLSDFSASFYKGFNVTSQSTKRVISFYSDDNYHVVDAYDYTANAPLQLSINGSTGPVMFGSTNPVTSGYKYEFTGDALVNGKLRVNSLATGLTAPTTTGTTKLGIVDANGLFSSIPITSYESPLTFNSGLTRSVNTVTLNQAFAPTWTAQHIFSDSIKVLGKITGGSASGPDMPFELITPPTLGANGGFKIEKAGWVRPGATRMRLNTARVEGFDGQWHFSGNSTTAGLIVDSIGSASPKGFYLGSGTGVNSGDNGSRVAFDVSPNTTNEWSVDAAYPSGVNFVRLQTQLNGPMVSTNTGVTGIRMPLKIDARTVDFYAGNTEANFSAAPVVSITPTGISASTVKTNGYTVATLPAGVIGMTAYVTDATAPTYLGTLTGGGAVKCPVFYNGTAWVSH